MYLSRPSAAWPSHASAIRARGHGALVHESCSRRQSSQRATRRGTKLQRHGQSRRPSPRVMKSLDPCRAAMVRRYAAELPDHNGSSDGCALLELDALCTALRSMCAVGRLTPLTSSHPATGRVHIGEARRPLPPSTGTIPVQWRSLQHAMCVAMTSLCP